MKSTSFLVIVVISLALLSGTAKADFTESVTWTSTNHFDSGNKSDPGPEYFVTNGVDQTTYSFISKPSAIYSSVAQKTFIVYQGGSGYQPYMVYYDHITNSWSQPYIVNNTNPVSGDGHGAPVFWIDSSGFIYVIFGSHATPFQIRKSTSPYDITSWVSLTSPTTGSPPSNQATYPHMFQVGNAIYILYRQGTAVGGDWGYRKTTNGGTSWSSFHMILDFGTDGAYLYNYIYVASQNRVYYNLVWDDRTIIVRKNVYLFYWDLLTDNQYSMIGNDNLGQVISLSEANTYARVVYSGSSEVWYSIMKMDSSYRPYLFFINGTGITYNEYNITFMKYDGSWSIPQILTTSDGKSSYIDFIINSPSNIEAFIVTAGFRQLSTNDDYAGDLERWIWNGSTWSGEILISEAKAGDPVNRPYVPLNANSNLRLIFDTWGAKDTDLPTARLYAWGNNGFVNRMEIPGETSGVETNTDNPLVPLGEFKLSNGNGDNFVTNSTDADTYKWRHIDVGDGTGTFTHKFNDGTSVYRVSATSPSGTGRFSSNIRGNFGISGTLNYSARFETTDYSTDTSGSLIHTICLFTQPDECDTVSGNYYYNTEGVYFYYIVSSNGNPLGYMEAVKRVGGVNTVMASTTSICDPCYFRITKSGDSWAFYRSATGISWTLFTSQTVAFTATVFYPHISVYSNGLNNGDSWAMEVDTLYLSGTLDSDGYRPSASWISPSVSWNENVPSFINITFNPNGAISADRYIDSIYLIDGSGNTFFQYGTNIGAYQTGDNFVNISVSRSAKYLLYNESWKFGLDLVGDGENSLSIKEITIFLETSPKVVIYTAVYNGFYLLVFISMVVLFFMLVFWLRKHREGVLR